MYELLILSINQRFPRGSKNKKIQTKPINKNSFAKRKRYYSERPFINNSNGILYQVYTDHGLGEFKCCDELFEFNYDDIECLDENLLPYFLKGNNSLEKMGNFLISISIKDCYREEFSQIINCLIQKSPIKTILFLCRGESLEEDVIIGSIKKEKFLEMLCLGKIYTDMCYIIEDL